MTARSRKDIDKKEKDKLKRKCFIRDGWCENVSGIGPVWFSRCAFGCGVILWMETATLDHYPIPYRISADWNVENLRLACQLCNCKDGGYHDLSFFMPEKLTWREKVEWFREREKYKDELISIHGIPQRNL